MKLIIQIPCLNEADSLPVTLSELPRRIEGVEEVEWLIIDDGSQDATVETAIALGADHVISHINNLGLAQAFISGINASLFFGADIIVNTDADNQYCASDIQKLIDPILAGKAEYVIGSRPIHQISHFSPLKKLLQKIGSWVVRMVSQTCVEDAPSGFRAISRHAALRLHVFNHYTYTLETIIQAGRMHLPTISVPVRTNQNLRASRLIPSIFRYLLRSSSTILRSFLTYQPLRFFVTPGILLFLATLIIGVRYLFFYFQGEGSGHVQSLIFALALFVLGTAFVIIGFLADLITVNRRLLEELDHRLKEIHLYLEENGHTPKHQQIFSRAYLRYTRHAHPYPTGPSAEQPPG